MSNRQFVIAYDLGTSGVKAALVDTDGKLWKDETENYPVITPQGNWAEQDPHLYWNAVCTVTGRVLRAAGQDSRQIAGIVFGTQWKGIIPLDRQGRVLRNSIIWLDKRAEAQAEVLNRKFGEALFCGSDYWPKLMWFRENQPELYQRSSVILEANAYLKWKATGVMVSDLTNNFTRSCDPQKQDFYNRTLEYAGLDPEKFPPLADPCERIGTVTAEAAEQMDLFPGIPVFGGCGDIPALAIGSGCCTTGSAHAYFGSSGWLGYLAPHDPQPLYVAPFDRENDIHVYGLGTVGLSLNWAIHRFYPTEEKKLGSGVYDLINRELEDIPPGSDRLLSAPWFFGGRPPFTSSKARGIFFNLGSGHDRRHLLNAVMEGVCYLMRMNLVLLNGTLVHPLTSLSACGGGACSSHWMQLLADITGIPVNVPENPRHAGAMGTAYCALIGLGFCGGFEEVRQNIRIENTFGPDPRWREEYDLLYEQFGKLYRTMEDLFQALN